MSQPIIPPDIEMNSEINDMEQPDIETSPEQLQGVGIELGDIIEINAPDNPEYHEQSFIVFYLDKQKIRMFNTSTRQHSILFIDDSGNFTDESIVDITLISRSESRGFSRQNGLFVHTWVDIHFGGEIPTIITGEITNLEEDCIEITTYPDLTVIYIDFAYSGIPETLPIEKIVIRDKPASMKYNSVTDIPEEPEDEIVNASITYKPTGEAIIELPDNAEPDNDMAEILHNLYLQGEDIIEEDLEEVEQFVEVADYKKRYTIDAQLSDMVEKAVNNVPFSQRTHTLMTGIHRDVQRYRNLREVFSVFDTTGNVVGTRKISPAYKPLVDTLKSGTKNVEWITPVISTARIVTNHSSDSTEKSSRRGGRPAIKLSPLQETVERVDEPDDEIDLHRDLIGEIDGESTIQWQESDKRYRQQDGITDEPLYDRWMRESHLCQQPTVDIIDNDTLITTDEVTEPIDTIVDNFGNYRNSSTKYDANGENATPNITMRRFHSHRFVPGLSRLSEEITRSGVHNFFRRPVVKGEHLKIKSLVVFPQSVIKLSRAKMFGSNVSTKVNMSHTPFYRFRALRQNTIIPTQTIDDLNKQVEYREDSNVDSPQFMTTIKQYVLDENIPRESDTYEEFVNAILPSTRRVIQMMRNHIRDNITLFDTVNELEPFGITIRDITMKQYTEIRSYLKDKIKEYMQQLAACRTKFVAYSGTIYPDPAPEELFDTALSSVSDSTALNWYNNSYHVNADLNSSQKLSQLLKIDGAQLYSRLVQYVMMSLKTPDKILDAFEPGYLDTFSSNPEEQSVRKSCGAALLVLAKRYNSVADMQNDNNIDTYFDREYDDTPYELIKQYRMQQRAMMPDQFQVFLAENLISRHSCPPEQAGAMAETLINGKKRVDNGDYALLETPISTGKLKMEGSEKEIPIGRKKQYFRRIENVWVSDITVSEEKFMDSKQLMCQLDEKCIPVGKTCESSTVAALQMRNADRNRMLREFDTRLMKSADELEEILRQEIAFFTTNISRHRILVDTRESLLNNVSYNLGKQLFIDTQRMPESPYLALRDTIMSQFDFVKRNSDIVRFVSTFCRKAMDTQLNEDPHWYYCEETNTKLFPVAHFLLADVFLTRPEEYAIVLDRLCNEQGKQVDNMIVDEYSGWELRKIDFAVDEEYDEQGFQIKSRDIMEKDMGTILAEMANKVDRVFDNPETQHIYNVFRAISNNIGLNQDEINKPVEEFVMRATTELMFNKETTLILSPEAYKRRQEREKDKQKRVAMVSYETYRDQMLVLLTASSLFVSIQTMIPSFRTKKTFPGCVKAFGGFPFESGVENTVGLTYMSCVIHKIATTVSPWKSIKTLTTSAIVSRMIRLLQECYLTRADVMELYTAKRDYSQIHPLDEPKRENDVTARWVLFQPPIVPFSMKSDVHGVSEMYEQELVASMRTRNAAQHKLIGVVMAKTTKNTFATVEMINNIVQSKDAVLITRGNIPFRDNACCNDSPMTHPLTYFTQQNPEITLLLQKTQKLHGMERYVASIDRGTMMYHAPFTGNIYTKVGEGGIEPDTVFQAVIKYCQFDTNLPIPREYYAVCAEKPVEYSPLWTLEEKIEFLKTNGKNYNRTHLAQLMQLVNNRNLVSPISTKELEPVHTFVDILVGIKGDESAVIDKKIVDSLTVSMSEYNPKVMVKELRDSTTELNGILERYIVQLLEKVTGFLRKYSGQTKTGMNRIDEFIQKLMDWTLPKHDSASLHTIHQYIKNAVKMIYRIAPEMTLSPTKFRAKNVKHWDFKPSHYDEINRFATELYSRYNVMNDPLLTAVLTQITNSPDHLLKFLDNLPVFSPLIKGNVEYYSLFPQHTVKLLLHYCFLTAIHEHILAAFAHTFEINSLPSIIRRQQREQRKDDSDSIIPQMPNLAEEDSIESEMIDIQMGNTETGMRVLGKYLSEVINVLRDWKAFINKPYSVIAQEYIDIKEIEKSTITGYFEKMSTEERRTENTMKALKLGRWSEGLSKSVFKYTKEGYDTAKEMSGLYGETESYEDIVAGVSSEKRTIEDIEVDEMVNASIEHDMEGLDISGLGEDYRDGQDVDYYDDVDTYDYE